MKHLLGGMLLLSVFSGCTQAHRAQPVEPVGYSLYLPLPAPSTEDGGPPKPRTRQGCYMASVDCFNRCEERELRWHSLNCYLLCDVELVRCKETTDD